MNLPLYQVDAFTDRIFAGNPAAVCPLDAWLDDAVMQRIANENNLAETAFFVPEGDVYRLRWFTPAVEVDLCGHATLATAHVLVECLGKKNGPLQFETRSGRLTVTKRGDRYELDFPANPVTPIPVDPAITNALGKPPIEVLKSNMLLAVYPSEADVRDLSPDMAALTKLDYFGVICTAPGGDVDFVSRFFAPKAGVPEDPVTGAAHCVLTPYWAKRLGKNTLRARQVSDRGGELWCEHRGERVTIAGNAVLYMEGTITI